MDFFDINKLRRDREQGELYDFFQPTFRLLRGRDTQLFVVGRESQMRADLVCNEIYGDVNVLDFLMSYNDIDNPLNIMENDILYFTSFNTIEDFRVQDAVVKDVRESLVNPNKSKKVDPKRQKFVEDKFALTPNQLEVPRAPISIEGDNFIIGG